MAKYSYKYLCGHGYGTVNLYGKESDRQRKLAWYADTFVCPDCFKKQKAEEDAVAPKTASLHLAVYGGVYQSIQVHGQLAANKEALKQLGYRWGDDLDGGHKRHSRRCAIAAHKLPRRSGSLAMAAYGNAHNIDRPHPVVQSAHDKDTIALIKYGDIGGRKTTDKTYQFWADQNRLLIWDRDYPVYENNNGEICNDPTALADCLC